MRFLKNYTLIFTSIPLLLACLSKPLAPTWYLGAFDNPLKTSALSKDRIVLCSKQATCSFWIASASTSSSTISKQALIFESNDVVLASSDEANKALMYTRVTYMSNRQFFESKYKNDVKLIKLLDQRASSIEACVDIGPKNLRGLYLFCSSSSDPQARDGGILFTSKLFSQPIGSVGDPQLYGMYYITYMERKGSM